jgi:hypothetical protein
MTRPGVVKSLLPEHVIRIPIPGDGECRRHHLARASA